MGRPTRHDAVALERQRDLAAVLIIANLVIGLVCAVIIDLIGWDLELSAAQEIACIAAFGVSLFLLLIAAGLLEWLPRIAPSLRREGGADSHAPNKLIAFIARRRMVPYYLGLWTNLVAIALLSEFTGKLESPFFALFIALVLIGQQVSRYRTQAGMLFLTGTAIVLAMWLCEPLVSSPSEHPPQELLVATVLAAFALGGLLNYYEKPHNHMVRKRVKPPTHARIYRDGRKIWRFAFYGQDPVLLGPENPPVADGHFPEKLRARFNKHAEEMGTFADWNGAKPEWPGKCEDSFVVPLKQEAS